MSFAEHFTNELWSDFVRQAAGPAAESAMRAHLQAGCAQCRATVEWLQQVQSFAAGEPSRAVPPALTQAAVHLFQSTPSWTDTLERLAATLIWQQEPALLAQGVRSSSSSGHRVLYRAGPYTVDVNVDRQPGEPGEIIGQIANETDHQEAMEGVLVQVVATDRTLVETATNRFGEFIIEYPSAKNAVLRFALPDRRQRIDVPLGV
jgi:hypothetical protein